MKYLGLNKKIHKALEELYGGCSGKTYKERGAHPGYRMDICTKDANIPCGRQSNRLPPPRKDVCGPQNL